MKTSEKLKILREENNLTREELANQLFVTKQAIYKWETGKNYPDINNLIKISDIYNLKVDDLLDESKDLNNINVQRNGVFLVDHQSKENLKTYINWLPIIGLITSALVFILFFGIIGVDDGFLPATVYCLLPFIVFTLLYIPLKIIIKRRKKEETNSKY